MVRLGSKEPGLTVGLLCLTTGGGAGAGSFALAGSVERIEELEDGALIGNGEVGDLLEALEETGGPRGLFLDARFEAEQFVAGDLQGLGELDEKGAGRLLTFGFIIGHDALGDAHGVAQFQALLLPRRPQHLPRAVLSAAEVEAVLVQSDLATPLGVRDRALLEVLYSAGIRRLELIHLTLQDVDPLRGVCFVREGKGQKDRVVPIGQRALDWIERYLTTARLRLVVPPDDGVLFLTVRGRPLATNRLSELVHRYVAAAGFPTKGSCHVFRHTLATLLLQGGADVRHIQAILGHADLRTTARYTHVVIDELSGPPASPSGGTTASAAFALAAGSGPRLTRCLQRTRLRLAAEARLFGVPLPVAVSQRLDVTC